jgi:hypothetical protein
MERLVVAGAFRLTRERLRTARAITIARNRFDQHWDLHDLPPQEPARRLLSSLIILSYRGPRRAASVSIPWLAAGS